MSRILLTGGAGFIGSHVLDALVGRVGVVADRGTYPGDFVGCHRHANAASTNHDPAISPAVDDVACDFDSEIGIVAALLGIRPAINQLDHATR